MMGVVVAMVKGRGLGRKKGPLIVKCVLKWHIAPKRSDAMRCDAIVMVVMMATAMDKSQKSFSM